MIAHGLSVLCDCIYEIRILADFLANHEKGEAPAGIVGIYPGRDCIKGIGSVIGCEKNTYFNGRSSPDDPGKKRVQKIGIDDNHFQSIK